MDRNLIEQVRHANDIVNVIQGYLPLKRAGANWRGICPFHQDTNPSLNVNPARQIFKCFACGKAGNVFTFVQEYEKLTFFEAFKKLAARAGIAIPDSDRTKTVSTKRDQLLQIYTTARDFYCENLFKHGQKVLDYLHKRSFSPETAKSLELGYSLASEKSLLNHLLKEGHSVSLLKESGLFGNYSGNLVDFFRGRLMFPIHSNIGEVIAFGGRVLEEGAPGGKYVNTAGTELYTKGHELYGLFKTKYEISKAGSVLISEGYFDFLRLYEAGFLNSVASLGTALTEDQVWLLTRYAPRAHLLYDGDAAGVQSAVRAALLCLSKGLEAFIVELPEEHDPDSFILEEGPEALRGRIAASRSVISFLAETPSKTPAGERIDTILDAVRALRDPVRRELLAREIAESFGISARAVFSKLRRTTAPPEEPARLYTVPVLEENAEERHLLILALQSADSFNLLAETLTPDYFVNRSYRELFKYLAAHADREAIEEPARLLDNIENKDLRDLLADFLFADLQEMSFSDVLNQVQMRKLQRDMLELDRKIQAEPDNLSLLEEKKKLSQAFNRLTKKVVRGLLT